MRTTLISIVGESDTWLELELLHRRRWPLSNRREVHRVIGIGRVGTPPPPPEPKITLSASNVTVTRL